MDKFHRCPRDVYVSKYRLSVRHAYIISPLIFFLIITLLAFPTATQADGFIVDRLDDDPTASACTSSPSDCSLRGAIIAANNNGASHDLITLPSGTINLALPGTDEDDALDGDLDIRTDLTIQGAGVNETIIDGNQSIVNEVIFNIQRFRQVDFEGMTIQNGAGGIYSLGSLSLTDCQIKDNNSSSGGGAIQIGTNTTLNINESTISNNTAAENGGGISAYNCEITITKSTIDGNHALGSASGGGILVNADYFSDAGIIIEDSVISNNSAGLDGGAISSTIAPIGLTRVIIAGNNALTGNGGAVFFEAYCPPGLCTPFPLSIENSDIKDNTSGGSGGGIYLDNLTTATITGTTVRSNIATGTLALDGGGGIYCTSELYLTNSTISGNQSNGNGGGIYGYGILRNVTVAQNTADADGIGGHSGGGISGIVNLYNSIVAENSGDQCAGSITSDRGNISTDATCNLIQSEDQPNTNPLLGPIIDNGGLTPTHALLIGSPAIDSGSMYYGCPLTDQRGITRPQGGGCDVGAFEQNLLTHLFLPLINK